MLATFTLVRPVSVAIAFAAVVIAAAWLRVRRPPPETTGGAAPPAGEQAERQTTESDAAPSSGRSAGGWAVLAVGLVAAALAAMLVASGTPVAHALLLLFGTAAAFALSVELYRRPGSRLRFESAALCVLARVGAWLVLLLVIGQPRWDWVVVDWEKPLLAVLLDQSTSMSIADRDGAEDRSRATLVNQAIADAQQWIGRLADLYEVQVVGVGDAPQPLDAWRVTPATPVSALAAALRRAGQSRSMHGEPPVGVLLVSDGAENAVSPRVVREAAAELAGQRTALVAVGVGPEAGLTPAVMLEPLVVPGRIGSRDRLRVPVAAQVAGCAGHTIDVTVWWGDEQADEQRLPIERAEQRFRSEFEVQPPGVGMHRLTARVTLPAELGGESYEVSTVVDVRDDRIRVLVLAGRPRSELAFAIRAIGGDPRFEVTQRLLLGTAAKPETEDVRWSGYDVVVLGDVPQKRLGFSALGELADAVRNRGVGLLMAGGRDFFHEGEYSRSELRDVSPVAFNPARPPDDYHPRFRPTDAGRRHPILVGIGGKETLVGGSDPADDVWDRLPVLGGAASLGKPKPLATILAQDSRERPLLAALEVGRGRSVAAAWDSTWPWALSSERGLVAHGKLWRQMMIWLANRRPVAWIVTDRSGYARAALAGGQQSVRIRAGLSGIEAPADRRRRTEYHASLELAFVRPMDEPRNDPAQSRPASGPGAAAEPPPGKNWRVPLARQGDEWRGELPRDLPVRDWLASGQYELAFVVEQAGAGRDAAGATTSSPAGDEAQLLRARTGFVVTATDPEMLEPTANLALLREAAGDTAAVGGAYHPISELATAVQRLAEVDRRLRIERPAAYDLVRRKPWWLLVLAVAALALEWVVRKRAGAA